MSSQLRTVALVVTVGVAVLLTVSQALALDCICGRGHPAVVVPTATAPMPATPDAAVVIVAGPAPVAPLPCQVPERKLRRGYGVICPVHGVRVIGSEIVEDASYVTTGSRCPCQCPRCQPTTPAGQAIR